MGAEPLRRALLWWLALSGLLLLPSLRAQSTAPWPRPGASVPASSCGECHERQRDRLAAGLHAGILQVTALPGCETCHGPGGAHSQDKDPASITMPPLLAAATQAALCGRCHQQQIDRHGGDPAGFRAAGLVCTDCHRVHQAPGAPVLPQVRFATRQEMAAQTGAVGSGRCLDCHPLRDAALTSGPHRQLAAAADPQGCERCHGPGEAHAGSGSGRLITRPDRAGDGVATCRSCHPQVDASAFHWRDRPAPLLSPTATCTTCHRVHRADAPPAPDAAPTNARCAGCHAAAFATMPGSLHQALGGLDTPLPRGCGSCHGGALAHAEAGGKRELLRHPTPDAACQSCHGDAAALQHWGTGDHRRAGVGCVDCHGPLHGQARPAVAATAQQQCRRCHAEVVARFALPNHHPVPEQRLRCGSCHDVHGARTRIRDQVLTEQRCTECHAAYRGPFVFAHQAQRRDGCVVCHEPHGSPTRRLLRQATTQQNCLSCHGDFPLFHDQTRGAVFTNCVRCHTEVHGSNHARFLFR